MTPVRLKPAAPRSPVKHFTTEPLRSLIFHAILSSVNLVKNLLFKPRNTIRVSNCLDLDKEPHSVGPDLGPNYCKDYQQTTKDTVSKDSYAKQKK